MKFTTILWDNDGVLVDTERHFFRASQMVLEAEGVHLSQKEFTKISLMQGGSVLKLLTPLGFTPEQIENKRLARNQLYDKYLTTVPLIINGVIPVLEKLKKDYRMLIVTGSGRKHFDTMHARTGILKHFEDFVTCNDYTGHKPSPVPYLFAMERFKVKCKEAVAIEDSPRGVQSAKGAGLFCIAIPNPLSRDFDYSKADIVLNSIGDLPGCLI